MTHRLVLTKVPIDEVPMMEQMFDVVGVYRLPMAQCDCPEKQRRNLRNWARGKKTGIPLCTTCKRPSRVWRSGIRARLEVALGKDTREQ